MRDYSKSSGEGRFKARPVEIAKRSSRNAARAIVEKQAGKAAIKGKEIDHKNANTSDNRLSNLRVVSPKENNRGRAGGSNFGRKSK